MRVFQIYVDDDRYSVPTLRVATLTGEARALEVAQRLLIESEHHVGVEVAEDGKRLFGLGSLGLSPARRLAAGEGMESAAGE